jgi:hypothetical protein
VLAGARFKGGRGADVATRVESGAVFTGARGNDRVTQWIYLATMYGGPGRDSALRCGTGSKLVAVEVRKPTICN